jgi:hypothetical protein
MGDCAPLGTDWTALRRGLYCTRVDFGPYWTRVLNGTRGCSWMTGRRWFSTGSLFPRYRSGHWSARLLRHGRGAARVLLSCAGAYVSGADGSNECPAGSVRIETEAACRTAVTGLGKAPGSSSNDFVQSLPSYPRGCYYDRRDRFAYFNPHAAGAGIFGFQLLCASVTTGAPPPHAADARAFTGV